MTDPTPSRRDFLKTGAVAASALASTSAIANAAYADGNQVYRVGLVGCGGRGTGAARQALRADPETKLVAMGDAFADKVETSLKTLQKTDVADRITVSQETMFSGLDAYKQVIDAGVDVVLLATPPYFRPKQLRAALEAGKHVFCEKPVAVDGPGIRHVLESTELAKEKGLALVSGLCWRYETKMIDFVNRIHEGQIGEIVHQESVRYLGDVGYHRPRQPEWTDLEYTIRNWYYHNWLSCDFVAEQFIHELDKQSWVKGKYPTSCLATGGRLTRTGEKFGNIYDHFSVLYEYDDGTTFHATTRQQPGCSNSFYDRVYGTNGTADLMKYWIKGPNAWRRRDRSRTDMHQLEHNAMYAALRSGKLINNGEYMAHSTMMGLMARMSAYTGQKLTWEQVMASEEKLGPQELDMSMTVPDIPVAKPGVNFFA